MHFFSKSKPVKCKCLNLREQKDYKNLIVDQKIKNNKLGDGEDFKLLEDYINSRTPIKFLHIPTNKEFTMTVNHFLTGRRPRFLVNGRKHHDTEWFKNKINELTSGEYSLVGEYNGYLEKTKIQHNCELCEKYIFEMNPNDFIGTKNRIGNRCPVCAGKIKKEYYYKNFLNRKFQNSSFCCISVDLENKRALMEHTECGKKFYRGLSYVKREDQNEKSILCPHCTAWSKANNIATLLFNENNIKIVSEKSFPELNMLRYDFQIFLNDDSFILLELDGIQHREFNNYFFKTIEDFERRKSNDLRKEQYAKDNNIELIRIEIPQNFNIQEQNILKTKLLNILDHYKLHSIREKPEMAIPTETL